MERERRTSLLSVAEQLRRETVTPVTSKEEPGNNFMTVPFESRFDFDIPLMKQLSPPAKSPRRRSPPLQLQHFSPQRVAPLLPLPQPPSLQTIEPKSSEPSTPSLPQHVRTCSSASSSGSATPPLALNKSSTLSPPSPPPYQSSPTRIFPLHGGVLYSPRTPPISSTPSLSFSLIRTGSSSSRSSLSSDCPPSPTSSTSSIPSSVSSSPGRTLRRRYRPPRGQSLRQIRAKESEACLKVAYDRGLNAYLDGRIALRMFGVEEDGENEAI